MPAIRKRDSGFSAIEMVVVIAILAGVISLATLGLNAVSGTTIKESASKLGGALRFAWDRSAMTGRVVRMAFDIEKGTYWLEIEPEQPASSSNRFVMSREKEGQQAMATDGGTVSHAGVSKKPESLLAGASLMAPQQIDVTKLKEGSAAASQAAIKSLFGGTQAPEPITFTKLQKSKEGQLNLGPKVAFDWIYTPHQRTRYDKGMAYAYFFPQGQAERAVVQLADRSGRRYWLWVHPLTGKVRIIQGEAQLDLADFERRDDEQNRSEAAPE